jgi:hypothetical protein
MIWPGRKFSLEVWTGRRGNKRLTQRNSPKDIRRALVFACLGPQQNQQGCILDCPLTLVSKCSFGCEPLTYLDVSDVFGNVDIYNSELVAHRPIDVLLSNISLICCQYSATGCLRIEHTTMML